MTAIRSFRPLALFVLVAALVLACMPELGGSSSPSRPAVPDRTLAPLVTLAPAATLAPIPTTAGIDPASGLPIVALEALPAEAAATVALIDARGPFPYRQDGTVFENREALLPRRDTGYYHEYTVETPGSADRGPRRIVTGADGEMYWTADHYDSFRWIAR